METQSPGALLALLDDVDWEVPGVHGFDRKHIDIIKSRLPALVNVALASTEDQARETHWDMDGDSQFGPFFAYPLQGVDVLTRLLPHATGPGGDWIMRDLRCIVDELPKYSGGTEEITDLVSASLMDRRATIDLAASGSALRLERVAHIALFVESEEWKSSVRGAALALGAADIVAEIDHPVRLWPGGGQQSPGKDQQRRIEGMFRSGAATTLFDQAALSAIYLEWRGKRGRLAALLYGNDSQDVILGSTLTSSRWVLRSDRASLASVRSSVLAALSTAGGPKPTWQALTSKVVIRAWINGQCKELRISRSRQSSDAPNARTWAELLMMFESTIR